MLNQWPIEPLLTRSMTTATAAAAVASATVSTAAMPSITAVPTMSMSSIRRAVGIHRAARATAAQQCRIDLASIILRSKGPGIEPLRLLDRVRLVPGTSNQVRIVVNHSAEQSIAVGRILRRVKDVLMPELIQIVLAFLVAPRNQREAGLSLQQGEKANIFSPGSFGPFKRPTLLFD